MTKYDEAVDEFAKLRYGAFVVLNRFALTAWREERGLTKSELAVAAQVSLSYLSEIESGAKSPSAGVIRRLADALKVNVHALVENPNRTEVVA